MSTLKHFELGSDFLINNSLFTFYYKSNLNSVHNILMMSFIFIRICLYESLFNISLLYNY